MKKKKAVILLSGGLDSTTVLFMARRWGYKTWCLIFDYGQRHKKEIKAAKRIAGICRCDYELVKFKLPWGGSSLLGGATRKAKIPRDRSLKKIGGQIPSTYVPGRNTIFISFGFSYAERLGAEAVFIGANSVDFSGYPDCRPEYFRCFEKLAQKGITKKGIDIRVPLLRKNKAEIIATGKSLSVPYELTWSCYYGGEKPCLRCDACQLRQKGFTESGFPDPLLAYEK